MLFSIDASFEQGYPVTPRAVDVARAFGIALDRRVFTVLDRVEVDVKPGDVVYITGESGAGKSILLRALLEQISRHEDLFGRVILADSIRIDEDDLLVESIGSSTDEAIRLLSMVGLGDAYLFLRRYRELSDGQRYRYRIARTLAESPGRCVLAFDEFCSMLDRDTAKVVSYLLQKVARASGKTLLVATAHDDLADDLKPDLLIRKYYGSRMSIEYMGSMGSQEQGHGQGQAQHGCSLLKHVRIEQGCMDDWHMLEEYHYRGRRPYGVKHVFTARLRGEVAGVILYSMPPPSCRGRNIALGRVLGIDEVNRNFMTISRIVVLPRFRGIGLAVMLVKHTMPLVKKRYIESIAVMGRYNPLFLKAGMREIVYEPDRKYARALRELEPYGFDPALAASIDHCYSVLERICDDDLGSIIRIVSMVGFAVRNAVGRGREYSSAALHDRYVLAKAIANIATLAEEKYYYIWENPEYSSVDN